MAGRNEANIGRWPKLMPEYARIGAGPWIECSKGKIFKKTYIPAD